MDDESTCEVEVESRLVCDARQRGDNEVLFGGGVLLLFWRTTERVSWRGGEDESDTK